MCVQQALEHTLWVHVHMVMSQLLIYSGTWCILNLRLVGAVGAGKYGELILTVGTQND